MTNDGKRLKEWRESLPGRVKARTLSVALGWEASRWWQLERKARWSPHHEDELRRGLALVLDWTDAAQSDRPRWIAYLLGEAESPPEAALRWLPGMCPAPKFGRPRSRTSRQAQDDEPGDEDPTPPPSGSSASATRARLQRSVAAILRTQRAGHLDEDEAAAAIVDMLAGRSWNSSMLSPQAA